jgi:hypothetical protein
LKWEELTMEDAAIAPLFAGREPVTRAIYDRLVASARPFGPFEIEPKKTCLHFARGSAFAGVHPRKDSVLVTLKTEAPIESPRVRKLEQASQSRFHNDLVLTSPDQVDAEFVGWMRSAYALSRP